MSKDLVVTKRGRGPLKWGLSFAQRSDPTLSLDAYLEILQSFNYLGIQYSLPNATQEEIGQTFAGYARGAYKNNPVVFACMSVRQHLFSEARMQFRQLRNGRPGDLFGTVDLAPLEAPGPGQTTGDLLSRMINYADLAGNWFGTNRYGGIRSLRPDWMTLIIGSLEPDSEVAMWDPNAEVVGYAWQPGGPGSGEDPIIFLPEEIAHFAPVPDPEARFRGMSWLTPVIREIMADKAFTDHKLRFTEQGATPNMLVKMDVPDVDAFSNWIQKFREQHEGAANSFKTLFLGAGMDATPIGTNFQTLDLKNVQGAGETRIAAAAGVPPIVVGLSEGLQGSSLNAGNYNSARRRFADITMRPLWRNAAGSLARLVNVPGGSELWYDDRDIAALQEDQKDAAEVVQLKAQAMRTLVDGGFDADSVVQAIVSGDLGRVTHSGMTSVQLHPPGTPEPAALPAAAGQNGHREAADALADFVKARTED